MTPKTIRLIVGFLAGFVLLSVAPAIPDFIANLNDGRGLALPAITDATLLAIGGCVALLGLVVLRRQRRVVAAQPVNRAPSKAVTRPSAATPLKRVMPAHSGPYPTILSPLQIRLRSAAAKGERVPALARRHGLSVDAIRAALGATALPAPAARTGSSFRSGSPSLPPKPRATPVSARRNAYQATL